MTVPVQHMTAYLDFTNLDGMTQALTAEDIAEGAIGDCTLCPVALAVGRMLDVGEASGDSVHITHNTATVYEHGGTEIVKLRISQRLSDWIYAFDHEQEVKPITLCVYTWNSRGFDYMLDMTDEDAQAMQAA